MINTYLNYLNFIVIFRVYIFILIETMYAEIINTQKMYCIHCIILKKNFYQMCNNSPLLSIYIYLVFSPLFFKQTNCNLSRYRNWQGSAMSLPPFTAWTAKESILLFRWNTSDYFYKLLIKFNMEYLKNDAFSSKSDRGWFSDRSCVNSSRR